MHGRSRPLVRLGPGGRHGGLAPNVDIWRAILRDNITELDATPADPDSRTDYRGWAHVLELGTLSVTDVGSDPVRVARTPRLIGRSQEAFYHLSIARRPSWARHAGQEIRMRTGDAVLLDGTEPFSLVSDGFAHHVVINVPRAALQRDLHVQPSMLGQLIGTENPMLRVLMGMISRIGSDTSDLPGEALAELGHTAGELLVSALRLAEVGRTHVPDLRMSHAAQLLRMQDFVRSHLAEPSLSPRTLAAAFGVSVRYVEVVFREAGHTPARFIRETRLAEARRMLADPRQRHRAIAAVGRSVGIENPSLFARAFREHYQVTPTQYRMSALLGGG
ncbi:helix-turn-helix domain-containing protein [Yinghuangia sp. YIM S10712]|uniref:helix-turn-helix domain-containing protein n=1 Tax=Yinghuangia sp. YIM S10712 TaxID=3436930 RepID=UPI003F53AEF8